MSEVGIIVIEVPDEPVWTISKNAATGRWDLRDEKGEMKISSISRSDLLPRAAGHKVTESA